MKPKKFTLATSKTCGPCSMLKNKLDKLGISVTVKDYTLDGDREFFTKHDIRSVPRLVVEDDSDGSVRIIQGMDDIISELQDV